MLNYLRKDNPKKFYKHFQKRKQYRRSELSNDDFFNHFSNLASNEPNTNDEVDSFLSTNDVHAGGTVCNDLDRDITEMEISDAIDGLKNNKTCGYDCVLNEYFIKCKDILMPCLLLLFNNIFNLVIFHKHGQLVVLFLCLKQEISTMQIIIEVLLLSVVLESCLLLF